MQKKREIVLVDKRMASRPDKVQSKNREETAKKTTYNVYSDAHVRGCKNRDKRKELYQQLNKAEDKERKEKAKFTLDFLPGKGVCLLVLSFY
jgi:adenylylsulfate kinase-like enzyme